VETLSLQGRRMCRARCTPDHSYKISFGLPWELLCLLLNTGSTAASLLRQKKWAAPLRVAAKGEQHI